MYIPTPHQVEDSDRMLETENALLWAEAGTGKTVTALEAFRKGGYKRGVIICPRLAAVMWKEELEKHLGLIGVRLVRGVASRKLTQFLFSGEVSFIITTMDLAGKHERAITSFLRGSTGLTKERGQGFERENMKTVCIIDEAHMLKTRTTKRTQAIFGRGPGVGITSLPTDTWQLTGTPILRHVDDLWTQLVDARLDIMKYYGYYTEHFEGPPTARVNKGYHAFVDDFCTFSFKSFHPSMAPKKTITGSKNSERLRVLLEQCGVIRRKLSDVVDDLPPITYSTIGVDYKNVPDTPVMSGAALVAALNDPNSVMAKVRKQLGVAKAADVVEYAKSFGKPPLLIGFWHHDVRDAIEEQLRKAQPNWVIELVDGSTSDKKREAIRNGFNAGEIDCILGQMQAMNTSWNLQEACAHVMIAEELPSPSMEHQFISRVYRKGQKKHVHIDHMTSQHELDKALVSLRTTKADVNKEVLD